MYGPWLTARSSQTHYYFCISIVNACYRYLNRIKAKIKNGATSARSRSHWILCRTSIAIISKMNKRIQWHGNVFDTASQFHKGCVSWCTPFTVKVHNIRPTISALALCHSNFCFCFVRTRKNGFKMIKSKHAAAQHRQWHQRSDTICLRSNSEHYFVRRSFYYFVHEFWMIFMRVYSSTKRQRTTIDNAILCSSNALMTTKQHTIRPTKHFYVELKYEMYIRDRRPSTVWGGKKVMPASQ